MRGDLVSIDEGQSGGGEVAFEEAAFPRTIRASEDDEQKLGRGVTFQANCGELRFRLRLGTQKMETPWGGMSRLFCGHELSSDQLASHAGAVGLDLEDALGILWIGFVT